MGSMDWDEFERRGEERRRMRRYPPEPDRLSLVLGAVICLLIIVWVVAGVRS